ncbi:two-component system sensor histidine kinase CreC [Vibrio coralliilyticus]|uniref:histidine kinase n=1 Tax=Vibrio coralliilyticus TaxID=190893 RepID=A0AAP6ZQD8_9VIBR|nr:two-component system sensor histidine kinase CreC [Vibrio coralliilyticus]NOH51982.1 two-component system sensor histidine kinase CreC [Vibrio coralliilyticus]NOJ23700.1 two-component system sensor histidine kinase CreC [Vibrio coralliilyticus]NUW70089.1 two-component system sensor histidine kinase CreC [Vibrio coralliilyticus]PAU36935.1 two-component system sensor histidine kinase CreC [Vibrio coralliilyticus]
MQWPKIPLGLRLFFLYFVLVGMTAYTVSTTVIQELKPTVRQTTEETLVDMANLLAVLAEEDVANGQISESRFSKLLTAYGLREPEARIWEIGKKAINHRIYITDKDGIVIADSWQQDVGEDYSRWNDVYLTLRGQYGARSTAEDPDDPLSTVMHVAAPIYHKGEIIGSVTVAKSNRSVQPFIDLSKRNVLFWMIWMSGLVLLAGALFAWRIHSALNKLENYAVKMGQGEKVTKPTFRVFYEYGTLSDALENMRNQLDGKQYVEEYVQTLTHELKSPLSAIKGASEILQMPLSGEKVARFATNIERESDRMQSLIDKLLELARLEKQPHLDKQESINIKVMLDEIVSASDARLNAKGVACEASISSDFEPVGDSFMFQQALFNLMDNALDFVECNGLILWQYSQSDEQVALSIFNAGPPIPDYAMPRLTERFYSLARQNGVKSTGLGLNFVEQVVKLHKGSLLIENVEQGVKVTLSFPSP